MAMGFGRCRTCNRMHCKVVKSVHCEVRPTTKNISSHSHEDLILGLYGEISAEKAEADIVVIGSGVGGLCCGGLLARYGQDVLVLESHDIPGGAAHSFNIKGYHFDSGPSLFSGLSSRGPQANPLAQVNFVNPYPNFCIL